MLTSVRKRSGHTHPRCGDRVRMQVSPCGSVFTPPCQFGPNPFNHSSTASLCVCVCVLACQRVHIQNTSLMIVGLFSIFREGLRLLCCLLFDSDSSSFSRWLVFPSVFKLMFLIWFVCDLQLLCFFSRDFFFFGRGK